MIRVAINGYGRIGRVAHRVILQKYTSEINIVAINAGSSTDLKGWMYLLKYDSNYGLLHDHTLSVEQNVSTEEPNFLGNLIVDDKKIPVYSQKDPSLLPWKEIGVDVVIDCTGKLLTKEKAEPHITSGAKSVIMSAPAKDDTPTYVLSVNTDTYGGN